MSVRDACVQGSLVCTLWVVLEQNRRRRRPMESAVFTVTEVAAYLRTDDRAVVDLLASGELVGFKVAGEWRVLGTALRDFLKRRIEESQLEALRKSLSD